MARLLADNCRNSYCKVWGGGGGRGEVEVERLKLKLKLKLSCRKKGTKERTAWVGLLLQAWRISG